MQIVIEIPEETYKKNITGLDAEDIWDIRCAIKNGIPLPKGHGRLIDEERISLSGIHFETERDHAMMIGRLNSAPTIIEADNESEGKE